jgi:hypothetical protein
MSHFLHSNFYHHKHWFRERDVSFCVDSGSGELLSTLTQHEGNKIPHSISFCQKTGKKYSYIESIMSMKFPLSWAYAEYDSHYSESGANRVRRPNKKSLMPLNMGGIYKIPTLNVQLYPWLWRLVNSNNKIKLCINSIMKKVWQTFNVITLFTLQINVLTTDKFTFITTSTNFWISLSVVVPLVSLCSTCQREKV